MKKKPTSTKSGDAKPACLERLVRTFSDDQQNALMTALKNAAKNYSDEMDTIAPDIVADYLANLGTASLVVELVDELNRLGWRISLNTRNPAPGWTVQASDYDKLAEAARWLRSACKDRLPPGHYDKVSEECRSVDAILCPNDAYQPRGDKTNE